jgi:hypothetical protein
MIFVFCATSFKLVYKQKVLICEEVRKRVMSFKYLLLESRHFRAIRETLLVPQTHGFRVV